MNSQSTHVIKIGGNLEDLKSAMKEAGKLFQNLAEQGTPPKEMTSSYEKIIKTLDKIKARTKDGVFRGTDAEYASILRELDSIGTEFETISRFITEIGKMDDDTLSKFLKKDDLKTYKQANNALQKYYELMKKINAEGAESSALTKVKKTLESAKQRKKDAEDRVVRRSAELDIAAGEIKEVTTARQITKAAKEKEKSSRDELVGAQDLVKTKKASQDAIQGEIDSLDAQIKQERITLQAELQELKNAKANFTRVKKFYAEADENGQARDTTKDYGKMSYQKAEARVAAAESKVSSLRELEGKREKAITKKATAAKEYADAKAEIDKYTKAAEEASRALREAEAAQKKLEEASAEGIKKYEAAEAALKSTKTEVQRLTNAVTDAQAAVDAVQESEDNGTNKANDLQNAYQNLREEAKKLGINLEEIGATEQYSEETAKALTGALEARKQELVQGIKIQENYTDTLEEAEEALNKHRHSVEESAEAQEKQNKATAEQEAFEARIKQFLGVAGAMQVLRSAVRDAMATIKELDATMTEMAVVTDLTVGDYWDQLPEYSQRASELGVSINSAYKAATLYYQQGLKTNEVNAISVETLKMAKIANLDAASATDKMTAALRGFNMELNEESAQRVSDVYSELAAITAADTKDIANAMTKTASIASSAGMEFETTAAFLSQIIETTRESAETAGTAMKTVIARFQELKKDPSEIGEVEGEVVDANKIETALRSVGVSLRDSAGQFRELDDVFLELSSKWNTLDTNTQRYIATIAAGSRQQSRFIAMMSDYERTQQLVAAANASAGASNRQFEKTLDSLDSKLEKLKNAWHEFTMGIMNSDLVKFGVDALTKFLEVVNKATSSFDGLWGSLGKIATVLGVFKLASKIFDKIRAPMISFFADVVKEAGMAGYKSGEAFAKKTREGLNASKDKTQEQQGSRLTLDSVGLGGIKTLLDLTPGRKKKNKAAAAEWLNQAKKEGRGKEALEWDIEKWTAAKAENIEGADENLEKAQRNLEEYHKQEVIATKGSAASWEEVGKGISQVGSALTAVGVGVSMLGGLLSSLGLEEAGELFSTVGQAITIVGGALTALGAIVPVVTSILSTAGITLEAAFWPILVIGLAIAALVATVAILIASFKALKAATPEGKLEAAKEKAEGLSDAAQQAADAFDQLNDSIDSISDKYAELDDMVQGTEAWRDAVREVNKQVMDLIEQYPELARFIENTDGVLKIDFEKKAVQEVLDKYESRAMTTQAAAQLGNTQVAAAETDVAYSKVKTRDFAATGKNKWAAAGKAVLSAVPGLTVGSSGKMEWNWGDFGAYMGLSALSPLAGMGSAITDVVKSYNNSIEGDTRELNEKVAQAMNDGIITSYNDLVTFLNDPKNNLTDYAGMAAEIWDNRDSFKAYRDALAAETAQREATTAAMLASAQSVANTAGFTAEDNKIMAGLEEALDINLQQMEAELAKVQWHQTDKLSSEQYTQLANAVKAQYGENAKIEGNQIKYYDADNNLQTVAIKDVSDRLVTQMASDKAVNDTKTAIEAIPELRKQFAGDSEMLALLSGETTLNQLDKIKEIDVSKFTEGQINALKAVYGDNYEKILKDKLQNEMDGFKNAEKKLKGINISEAFGDVSAEAANALANIATNTGWGGKNNFVRAFQAAQGSLSSQSDKNQFTALFGSMEGKEESRESWENLEKQLKEQNLWNEEVAKFITDAIEKSGATYSETYLTGMGVSNELYSRYQQAVISGNEEVVDNFHKTFKKWKEDYEVANDEGKKAEHELKTAIADALTKSAEEEISKLEALTDAVNEANEKMVQAIQKQIDEERQARDNAKEEESLNDLRNRIAYLRASGASPLELMQAEEELATAEENYSDKLVDQSIAKLEDANEKAASQREEQINLLRSQLEFWKETQDFKTRVDEVFEEARTVVENGGSVRDTDYWELMGYDKLSEFEQGQKALELDELFGKTVRKVEDVPFEKKLHIGASGTTDQTPAGTALGGSTTNRAETMKFNKDLSSTWLTNKEDGADSIEVSRDVDAGHILNSVKTDLQNQLKRYGVYDDNLDTYAENWYIGYQTKMKDAGLEDKIITYEEFKKGLEVEDSRLSEFSNANWGSGWNTKDLQTNEDEQGRIIVDGKSYLVKVTGSPDRDLGMKAKNAGMDDGSVFQYKNSIYLLYKDIARRLASNDHKDGQTVFDNMKNALGFKVERKYKKYKTGGLADFTGPAWLDGTKSRPEYVLNSAQTERFFSLVDILEGLDTSKTFVNSSSGDNHFEIEINVEKLENDYDVEQLADKIRRMIYDDASYRNVNTVGLMR